MASEAFSKTWSFYTDPNGYTVFIDIYLKLSSHLLVNFLGKKCYDSIIELGCADGSYFLREAVIKNVDYWGIDFISESSKLFENNASFLKKLYSPKGRIENIIGDIHEFSDLVTRNSIPVSNSLVILPFNLLGVLIDPEEVIRQIAAYQCEMLIFSFCTNPIASWIRKNYYGKLFGHSFIQCLKDDKGVLFTKYPLLYSYAFKRKLIQIWLTNANYQMGVKYFFRPAGVVYYCFPLKE